MACPTASSTSTSTGRALSIAIAAALGIVLAVVIATPARADRSDPAYPGSAVHVSVTGPRQAGKVLTITATGTNTAVDQPGGAPVSYGLELIVVDPAILKGPCEVSEQKELSDITRVRSSGQLLNVSDLDEGASGPFRIVQLYEPGGYGPLLVCAYSKFITDDAAYGSTQVHIAPAAGAGDGGSHAAPGRPRSLARPVVRRSHDLLSCSRGRWDNEPTRFTYRWKLGSGRFGSARTSSRFALPAGSRAATAVCSVTAGNRAGSARSTSRRFRLRSP